MNLLEQAREDINLIDRNMADLFQKRMEAVKNVAKYKYQNGIPVFDAAREQLVIERNSKYIEDPTVRSFYVRFLQNMMGVSKQYQHTLLEGMKTAYSGIEGAFACIAARRIFKDAQLIPCTDFEAAYRAVESGECDNCVLPIENSVAGEVGQVMDLMFSGSLYVNGVYTLPVVQSLLGVPGATIADIKTVISHPQALSQSAAYISAHGLEKKEAVNTAVAAKFVAETADKSLAAIANAETAELYGLNVLERNISESAFNSTRFAVFTRSEYVQGTQDTFLLLFKLNHVAGALADAVNTIAKYGFNMKSLHSRPVRNDPWQYYFYCELEGNCQTDNGKQLLKDLSKTCPMLKVAGHFTRDIILKGEEKT